MYGKKQGGKGLKRANETKMYRRGGNQTRPAQVSQVLHMGI